MTTRAPRGRPTITKRADGLWHCDVDFGTDPVTGERRRKHVKRATRKQVADIVADLERSRNAGLTDPDKVTLGQWFEMWLTTGASHRKVRTTLGYASHYRCYIEPRLGLSELRKLSTKDIEKFLLWMVSENGAGVSASTAGSVRRTLRACLSEAVREGRITRNPATYARTPPGEPTHVTSIRQADIPAIVAGLKGHWLEVRFLLGLTTGMRQGEILALRWCDLDLDTGTVTVSGSIARHPWRHGCTDPIACAKTRCRAKACAKPCARHTRPCPPPCADGCTRHASTCPNRTGGGMIRGTTKTDRVRTIAISTEMVSALKTHLRASKADHLAHGTRWRDDGYVFCYPDDGRPVNPRTDWGAWGEILETAGVEHYRVHSQRHYAASQMLVARIDVTVMMAHLGWSSAAMVKRYAHVVDTSKREAANAVSASVFG